jgi:hypothetical protein
MREHLGLWFDMYKVGDLKLIKGVGTLEKKKDIIKWHYDNNGMSTV